MSKLHIVATPIGNLKDVTLRALHVLEEVDLILCEDTRVTKKLLNRYNIKTPVESYHQHSKLKKVNYILNLLKQGKNLALVSDSGTPGVSDPGSKLISYLVKHLPDLKIVPIPGPSTVTAAVSVSGLPVDEYIFLGFPPHKKGRQKFFKETADSKHPVVIFESPHRILKTLKELSEVDGFDIVVCRELTKKFETIYRGEIKGIIRQLEKEKPRGEFVIIISKKTWKGYW